MLPYARPAWRLLDEVVKSGKRVLFEGAQGALLDVDHGTYPYVTSSNTVAGQAAAGSGLGPKGPGFVLGIVKAYTTRVGEGPFPTELDDEVGRHLSVVGKEQGTVTGRQRRCGWFDAVLVRQSVALNGIEGIALTKLDILDGLPVLKICIGYQAGDQTFDYLPAGLKLQSAKSSRKSIAEEMEGLEPDHPRRAQFQGPAGQCGEIRPPGRGTDRRAGGAAVHQPAATRRAPS